MKTLTLEEKINIIENSHELGEIPLDAMPFMQSDEYYFVSYSHRDYKKVYGDILRLQNLGVNIWYDRGLPAGRNWQDIADEAISKHACKGVIFYISENSLLSDAVEREILFVKGKQKDYLSINIPLEDGEQKSESAISMLEKLCNKKQFSQKKKQVINDSFGDEVLFIDYKASAEFKAEKIRLLKAPPILQYQVKYDMIKGEKIAVVDNVLDLFAKEIKIPYSIEFDGEDIPVREIGECAFANCKYLKSVIFPKKRLLTMKDRAFYGCSALEEIDLHNFSEIGNFAFSQSDKLKKVILANTTSLGDGVFSGTNLKDIQIVKKNGKQLLESNSYTKRANSEPLSMLIGNANLKKYGFAFEEKTLLYNTPDKNGKLEITFYNTKTEETGEQSSFENDDLTVFAIGDSSFVGNENVRLLTMIPSTRVIGAHAFENCVNLTEFNYITSTTFLQLRYCIAYNRATMLKSEFGSKPLCVGEYAFNGCSSMERIMLPPFICINEYAFANCFNLQKITFAPFKHFYNEFKYFANSYVGEYAFYRCVSLSEVEIPETVSDIKRFAFGECKRLKKVFLNCSNSLKSIDKRAFYNCKNLSEISFNGAIEAFLNVKQVGVGLNLQKQFKIVCLDGVVE